jgi:hypothetical protein
VKTRSSTASFGRGSLKRLTRVVGNEPRPQGAVSPRLFTQTRQGQGILTNEIRWLPRAVRNWQQNHDRQGVEHWQLIG